MDDASQAPADIDTSHLRTSAKTDWYLQQLVRLGNQFDQGTGVTLQIGSSFVSGHIISARAYFAELGPKVAAAFQPGPVADSFAQLYKAYAQSSTPDPAATDEPPPQFIHLKDVSVWGVTGDGHAMKLAGGLWRGRIACVDGFVLGNFGSAED